MEEKNVGNEGKIIWLCTLEVAQTFTESVIDSASYDLYYNRKCFDDWLAIEVLQK